MSAAVASDGGDLAGEASVVDDQLAVRRERAAAALAVQV